jgi:tetratricopeptide (TPR) repeat protein
MKRLIFITLVLLLGFIAARAEETEEAQALFEQANAAYQEENYGEAVRLYESVLEGGFSSKAVYFNLGNAYYRQGEVAESILNYERALLLDPDDEDVRHNLSIVQTTRVIDNIEPLPDLFIIGDIEDFFLGRSSRQWALVSIVLVWIAVVLVGAFLFLRSPSLRRWTFFGGLGFLLLSLIGVGVSLGRRNIEVNSQEGIVFQPNVYVKDAPGGKTDLIILHEGIKVAVSDSLDGWYNIRLEDAKVGKIAGWVPVKSLVKI